MKFGVLLGVPWNEARKSLRNPASCSVLTCAFDGGGEKKINKKILKKKWKGEWTVQKFGGDLYPTTLSLYTIGFTSIAIDLPEE